MEVMVFKHILLLYPAYINRKTEIVQ